MRYVVTPIANPGTLFVCLLRRCRLAMVARASLTLVILSAVAFPSGTFAQNAKPTQYDVEAAYLYRFGNFVQWPASANRDRPKRFPICVLGRDPFGPVLDQMVKQSDIDGIPLSAKRIASAHDALGCRIVFVSSSENRRLDQDLADLRTTPVLTVSSIPDFMQRGGMIQFVIIDRRVRFEINISNAERAGLKLSSQLLKVAVAVRSDRNPKE
jgi:hypothetical protein